MAQDGRLQETGGPDPIGKMIRGLQADAPGPRAESQIPAKPIKAKGAGAGAGRHAHTASEPLPQGTYDKSLPVVVIVSKGDHTVDAVQDQVDAAGQDHFRSVYHAGVATGANPRSTPVGETTVVDKVVNPTWTPTKNELKKNPNLRPHLGFDKDPSNPEGPRLMKLGWDLIGIHGTNRPDSIGKNASNGCIRMRNDQVQGLYDKVKKGTHVFVTNGSASDVHLTPASLQHGAD